MTTAICFSKNRAAQLDLLLHSIEHNAPGLYSRVHVIWKADGPYADAYRICQAEHEWAEFACEGDLGGQTLHLVERAGSHVAFLMDDCVFYRPRENGDPIEVLEDEDILCFSPRLGLNTTECYPLRRPQALPEFLFTGDDYVWDWTNGAECDWSYPASLDGHVFRSRDLRAMLNVVVDWRTPNTLESSLVQLVGDLNRPLMAAHVASSLVGVPTSRVSETHLDNRYGEQYNYPVDALNSEYLNGKRFALDISPEQVNAAHVEVPLRLVYP